MTIRTAIDNTISQFPSLQLQTIQYSNRIWTFQVGIDNAKIKVELDELTNCACVLERKNIGYKSMHRFMNALMHELEQLEEDEDPIPPTRD